MKAIFLDRDGVINELIERPSGAHTSPFHFSEFIIKPHVGQAIEYFKHMDYKVFVVTNQPHLDKGLPLKELMAMNGYLHSILKVDGIEYCQYQDSYYYKPEPGMIFKLIKYWNVDPTQSWMIGDRWKDIVAGARAGLKTMYLGDKYECPKDWEMIQPDETYVDLFHAAECMMGDFYNEALKE